MKISIPALSVGGARQASARARDSGAKFKLLSINGSPSTTFDSVGEQAMLQASLLAAGVFAPDKLGDAVEALRDDPGLFYADSEFDSQSVQSVLRFVLKAIQSNGDGTPIDYFAQYAAKYVGLSAALVAACVNHFQQMSDAERSEAANSVVNYAASIVPLEQATVISQLARNRLRVSLLSRSESTDPDISEQVRINTNQIKDLVAKIEKKPVQRKKRKT